MTFTEEHTHEFMTRMNILLARSLFTEEEILRKDLGDPNEIVNYYEDGELVGQMPRHQALKLWWEAVMERGSVNTFMTIE